MIDLTADEKRSQEAARATIQGRYMFWRMNVDNPQNRPLLKWWETLGGAAIGAFLGGLR